MPSFRFLSFCCSHSVALILCLCLRHSNALVLQSLSFSYSLGSFNQTTPDQRFPFTQRIHPLLSVSVSLLPTPLRVNLCLLPVKASGEKSSGSFLVLHYPEEGIWCVSCSFSDTTTAVHSLSFPFFYQNRKGQNPVQQWFIFCQREHKRQNGEKSVA